MSVPSVTWIIPVLNGMPFLPEALDSIRRQTYQDHEVLVWDNGSTDGTLDVLREWIPKRLPGRVFTGEPLSLGLSLRRLVEHVRTPLIARMDADDICEPERLAVQIAHMKRHPELAAIGSERTSIDAEGHEIQRRSLYPSEEANIRHHTLRAPRLLHPSVLMQRDVMLQIGNYQDHSTAEYPYWCEDYDLWLRMLAEHRVAASPQALIRYRYNLAGVTESVMRQNLSANAKRRAWLMNCEAFAGIRSKSVAARLWDRRLFLAMPVILGIARHFQRRDGITVSDRLQMSSFVRIAQSYLRREDLITRIWLRMLSRKLNTPETE
jgi:glycosyltransferase involved in cell wall biosynthesis